MPFSQNEPTLTGNGRPLSTTGRDVNRREALRALSMLGAGLALPLRSAEAAGKKPVSLDTAYLGGIRDGIATIRDTSMDAIHAASEAVARTRKNGGTCFYQWETTHTIEGDMFPDRPGDTDLFVMGYTMGKPAVEPKKGDLLFVNVIRAPLEDPRAKGIFVVGGPNPWCADTIQNGELVEANKQLVVKKYSDIWIDMPYTRYGSLLPLPGEEVPLGPTPALYGAVTAWSVVADAVRLLARDGVPVRVKGGEPPLGNGMKRERLDRPLAEKYFAATFDAIDRIGKDIGIIRRAASEAADRILSGGRLYAYSRYRESLSAEANQRRGGLALINATWSDDPNFKGTGKDFMVMGVYRPDDPEDIAMFDRCHAAGMKVAVLGPPTLAGERPAGRSVPREADFHMADGCDTYGLFALPCLERRICPISGFAVAAAFWTFAAALADEIIARTGNAPGVLSTGAVVGGAEQRTRANGLVKTRGY